MSPTCVDSAFVGRGFPRCFAQLAKAFCVCAAICITAGRAEVDFRPERDIGGRMGMAYGQLGV